MTELSALNIRITGDADGLKAATTLATGELAKVGAAADTAGDGTARLGKATIGLGKNMVGGVHATRNMALQLSQVAQQTMVTGNFVQALSIQLPDMALGFGTVGIAAGVLAGVALPVLMSAFSDAGDEARDLEDINADLADAIGAMRKAGEDSLQSLADLAEKYGTAAANAQTFLSAIADVERLKAVNALNEAIAEIATTFGEFSDAKYRGRSASGDMLKDLREELELNEMQAIRVRNALDALNSAKGVQEQLEAANGLQNALMSIYGSLDAMPEPARLLYENIATAGANAAYLIGSAQAADVSIGGAADEAGRLAANMAEAVKQAAIDPELFKMAGAYQLYGDTRRKAPTSPVAHRKGKVSPLFGDLEKLQATLATEAELIAQNYADQQETLQLALKARLITQDEFQEMSKRSAQAYADAMAGINSGYHGDALDQAGAFFGDMANAMQGGNEKMLRIAKVFGAANALIDAFQAYNQVLADKSLPWFAKIPVAAGILAAGMGMVNAIKGVNSGGGRGGGGGSGGTGGQAPMQVSLNTYGGNDFIRAADFGMILDKLNAEAGDRGYKLMVST